MYRVTISEDKDSEVPQAELGKVTATSHDFVDNVLQFLEHTQWITPKFYSHGHLTVPSYTSKDSTPGVHSYSESYSSKRQTLVLALTGGSLEVKINARDCVFGL
jgi:hypothetical protein